MFFKRSIFGYSKKDVNGKIEDYENLIDLQRRDIEYLKRDNSILKSTILRISKENDESIES